MARFQSLIPRFAVSNLFQSLVFYNQRIGFEVAFLWPEESPTFAILKKDQIEISLFEADAQRPDAKVGTLELYIECDDVRGQAETYIGQGLKPEWGPEVFPYGRRECAFADPDGHLIILSEGTGDKVECEG